MGRQPVEGWSPGFQTRLRYLIKSVGGRAAAAAIAGRSEEQISNSVTGKSAPSIFALNRICEQADISLDWILTGRMERHSHIDPCMMDLETVLPLNIDRTWQDPVLASGLQWYRASRSDIRSAHDTPADIRVFSIVHTVPKDGLPEYQFCGVGSMAALYYGSEFAEDPLHRTEHTDRGLEERAAIEYRHALYHGEPTASWVSTVARTNGQRRLFRYFRMVLPVNVEGIPGVMVLARETHGSTPLDG